MPGPLRRLVRQPLRIAAVVLLGVTALAAAGVHSAAAGMLQATVDDNWRGDYDILVTANGELADVDGMLPPNALAGPEKGLSLKQWQTVQALDGVDVAAPIGEILVPGLRRSNVSLRIPESLLRASSEPRAFRLTTTYTTDDGLGERIVDRRSVPVFLDGAQQPSGTATAYDECRQHVMFGLTGDRTVALDPARYPALVDSTSARAACSDSGCARRSCIR